MSRWRELRSADGTRITFRTAGSGPPLVLVHGGCTSSADWPLVTPFLQERFTVVAVDRRGRGRSGDAREYALEREAEDILAVLGAVGAERLVGHSYGALCAMRAASRTHGLARLVLYEPPIGVQAGWLADIEEKVAAGELDAAVARFLRSACGEAELAAIRASRAWPVLLDAVPTLPRELAVCRAWRPPDEPIDVPTLLLVGGATDNRNYLDGLETLRESFADLRVEAIDGQRHLAHVFAPDRFAAIIAGFCG